MAERSFCARISEERQEPFVGLAPFAEIWVMIEYTGPWGWSAVLDNDLPEPAAKWLSDFVMSYETMKGVGVFVRQHSRPLKTIRCFVGVTLKERTALYAFEFERYEELLSLDLAGLKAGAPAYDRYLTNEPMYIICTNGKHDMCCAKFGMPIYRELARLDPAHTWHCSHIGGDQFAANLICFPQGVYYSRVAVPEVETILDADRHGRLYLPKCRGRVQYPAVVQAAEYYVRMQTGIFELGAFSLQEVHTENESDCVTFCAQDGALHHVRVQSHYCELDCPLACSCNQLGKNYRQEYRLIEYQVQASEEVVTL